MNTIRKVIALGLVCGLSTFAVCAEAASREPIRLELQNVPPQAEVGVPVRGDIVAFVNVGEAGPKESFVFTLDLTLENAKRQVVARGQRECAWGNGKWLIRLPEDMQLIPDESAGGSVELLVSIRQQSKTPRLQNLNATARHTYAVASAVAAPPSAKFTSTPAVLERSAQLPGKICLNVMGTQRRHLALRLALADDRGNSLETEDFAVSGFNQSEHYLELKDTYDLKAPMAPGKYRLNLYLVDLDAPASAASELKPADTFAFEVPGAKNAEADPNAAFWEANSEPLSEGQKRQMDSTMGK